MSYTKLHNGIINSSVWSEPDHVRLVWITMLAMKDRDGVVEASVSGLSHASRVTRKKTEAALERLMAPDPDSRTPDHDGRRIAKVDGGWRILNSDKYRDKLNDEDKRARDAERQRRYRENKAKKETGQDKPADTRHAKNVTERDSGVTARDGRNESRESRHTDTDPNTDPNTDPVDPPVGPPGDPAPAKAPRKRKPSARPLPDDWQPTPEHATKAKDAGLNLDHEAAKFRAHAEANARRQVQWNAAFSQWLLRSEEYAGPYAGKPPAIDPKPQAPYHRAFPEERKHIPYIPGSSR